MPAGRAGGALLYAGCLAVIVALWWLLRPHVANGPLRALVATAIVVAVALAAITAFYAYRRP